MMIALIILEIVHDFVLSFSAINSLSIMILILLCFLMFLIIGAIFFANLCR